MLNWMRPLFPFFGNGKARLASRIRDPWKRGALPGKCPVCTQSRCANAPESAPQRLHCPELFLHQGRLPGQGLEPKSFRENKPWRWDEARGSGRWNRKEGGVSTEGVGRSRGWDTWGCGNVLSLQLAPECCPGNAGPRAPPRERVELGLLMPKVVLCMLLANLQGFPPLAAQENSCWWRGMQGAARHQHSERRLEEGPQGQPRPTAAASYWRVFGRRHQGTEVTTLTLLWGPPGGLAVKTVYLNVIPWRRCGGIGGQRGVVG